VLSLAVPSDTGIWMGAPPLEEVVRRHESLRSGFAWLNGQPVAGVVPAADIGSVLEVEDARRRTAEEPAAVTE
jgi:hypothetical protein